jgi:VWFA-related protein
MRLLVSLAAAVVGAGIVLAAVQDPAPTFRGGVDLVDIDVSVLDRNRLPVEGLRASDFQVFENGRPRPIVTFAPVTLPRRELPSAQWMVQTSPDVVTNDLPATGRLVAIVIDQSIASEHIPIVRELAMSSIDELRPGDLAAVLYTAFGVPQGFTADRRLLVEAIERPFGVLDPADAPERAECLCGACSLQTVAQVAESLEDVRQRRRVLIYIGSELRAFAAGNCTGFLEPERLRALRALEASNMTVHVFDPTGLESAAPTAQNRVATPRAIAARNLARRNNLQHLPDHTGGRTEFSNEPRRAVAATFRESTSYYVLGIEPDGRSTRRYNDISVKVAGRDVMVQARRGYYTAATTPSRQRLPIGDTKIPATLRAAIASMWPRSDLTLALSAVPLAGPGPGEATVAVGLGIRRALAPDDVARLTEGGLNRPRTIDVLVGAFDRNGQSRAYARQTVQTPIGTIVDSALTYELTSRLSLPPGRYELRAAATDEGLGATGSVYGYVVVPNFARDAFSASGILFDVTPRMPSVMGASLMDLLPVHPTTSRVFDRLQAVTAFLREHQGVTHAAMPGYLTAEIYDESDRRVFRREVRLLPEQLGANRAVDLTIDVPVNTLTPGRYLLTMEVRHGNQGLVRDAPFTVR